MYYTSVMFVYELSHVRTCVGILYVSVCVCVFEFCNERSPNLSQTSPGKKQQQ